MGEQYDREQKARLVNTMYDRAKLNREQSQFDKYVKELDDYDTANDEDLPTIDWDQRRSFYVKTCKTQQFKREIGARLITSNPRFRTSVKEWAGPKAIPRAQIAEGILNTSVTETDWMTDTRRATDGGLGYGRGVLRIGMNGQKNLPMVKCYSAKDIWTDPDATNWHQVKWIAIRNRSPKWDLADRYPDYRHRIYEHGGEKLTGNMTQDRTRRMHPTSSEMVDWIEMYTLEGCERYQEFAYQTTKPKQGKPTKYVFIPDSGFLLYEGEWETPFYKETGRQAWPIEVLDFYYRDDSLYPDAPLRPGIPWLRAYNFMQSIIFMKSRRSSQDFILFLKVNGVELDEDSKDKVMAGDSPFIDVCLNKAADKLAGDDTDLRKYLQQFSFDSNIEEMQAGADNCLRRFEEETGLYQFLYVGDPGTQDRSAAATHLRERYSRSRIDDFINTYEEFLSRVGRKMAITARFHMDSKDVTRYLGEQAGEAWGRLMLPEQMDPMYQANAIMQRSPDMPVGQITQTVMAIIDQGVIFEQFLDETDFQVEAGSTKRKTPAEEQAGIEWITNQMLPTIVNMGATRTASLLVEKAAKDLGGLDDDELMLVREEFDSLTENQANQTAANNARATAEAANMTALPPGM